MQKNLASPGKTENELNIRSEHPTSGETLAHVDFKNFKEVPCRFVCISKNCLSLLTESSQGRTGSPCSFVLVISRVDPT